MHVLQTALVVINIGLKLPLSISVGGVMEDLYQILGCPATASQAELRKSFQELALKYHPDKTHIQGASDMFVKVNRSWKILSDPALRERYDVKWRDRCLAQMYPIQDKIDFDDFELVSKECDNVEGMCDLASCDLSKTDASNATYMIQNTTEEDGRSSLNKDSDSNMVNHDTSYLFTFPCRCGGSYILTSVDVKLKFDIVCCDSCSLTVEVNYNDESND
ncbi:hypothetical protein DPMN_015600 [Dreissena polymorpha]|uniref:Uncharacterized protein n=2 Tax=Dreissena polymorpha TaxID=45954 RepID=A0A9D4S4K3_DREPO|nr:hypothetical protein DPMN_015600 [Dreissena polymorpha]